MGKLKQNQSIAIILAIVLISSFLFSMSFLAGINNSPTTSDILLVQVGQDQATEIASNIIEDSIAQRNADAQDAYANQHFIMQAAQPTRHCTSIKLRRQLDLETLVVSAEALKARIMTFRATMVVVVGHGSELGIEEGGQVQDWSEVVSSISVAKPKRTVFATCYGENAASLLDGSFGFGGAIDARVAGYLSSAIVLGVYDGSSTSVKSCLDSGIRYAIDTGNNKINPIPLGELPAWWAGFKIVFMAAAAGAFYILSPVTAPSTAAQLVLILIGAAVLAVVILAFAILIELIVDFIAPGLSGELLAAALMLRDYSTTAAGLIAGGIAAYLTGSSYPGLLNFISNMVAVWTGRTASESACAADPEPISRGLLAISAGVLLVTAIELFILFYINDPPPTQTSQSEPPASDPPPSDPSPGGGGGGSTYPKDVEY